MRKRPIIFASSLFLVTAIALGHVWDMRRAESMLSRVAAKKVAELTAGAEASDIAVAAPQITVTRDYLLVGRQRAKIALYMRPAETAMGPDLEHSHDREIVGFEYILTRRRGEWTIDESVRCSSEQCVREGSQAFEDGLFDAKDS